MTEREFEEIMEGRFKKSRRVLGIKSAEYARGDKLSNFKKAAAARRHQTAEGALLGMMMKHIISIIDLIEDLQEGKMAGYELWDEKIGDTINYLILLDALILERLNA